MFWKAITLAFIAGAAVATAVVTWYKGPNRNDQQGHCQDKGEPGRPAPKGDEARTCSICLEYERDTVMQPCGHICSCNVCALELNDCPICRTRIESLGRVYLA